MATIFWAWDSQLVEIRAVAAAAKRRSPEGFRVEVLGEAGSLAVGELGQRLTDAMVGAAGVLAVVDTPNANMAWEVGMALGRGLRVALATEGRDPVGQWPRGTPLESVLRVGDLADHWEGLLARFPSWMALPTRPRPGERKLVVCAGSGAARAWVAPLRAAGWEVLDTRGWSVVDLPQKLDGVGRLVWVMSPLRRDDTRHGVANTVGALVAGYADMLGLPVKVLAPEGAPEVLDATRRLERVAATEDALIAALAAWSVEPPRGDTLGAWRGRVVKHHANPLAYVARMGLDAAELVPIDLDVEESGEIDRMDRPGRPGARSGRLRQLVDLDRAAGRSPRWLVKAEPGAGKTTLLRQLAHELAREGQSPLFVSLPEWEGKGGDVVEAALRQMDDRDTPPEALRAEAERAWLFLDGFDEVRDHEKMRQRVVAMAAEKRWRATPIVVTSRAGAVERGSPWADFTPAALRYLGPAEQDELVARLLGRDPARIAAFHTDMKDRPGVAVLLRNPFLLTLAVGLHARAKDREDPVPCDRVALLGAALDDCLTRGWAHRPPDRERDERWSPVAARIVLRALALELHRAGGEAWTRPAIARVLHRLPTTYPEVRNVYGHEFAIWKGESFLDDVQHHAGVLGPLDGDGMEWRFLHRSLLEMLAAECLVEEVDTVTRGRVVEELLAEKRSDTGGGPGRSAEVQALTAGLLAGRGEATAAEGMLRKLVKAAPDAAKRALAGLERIDAWTHLSLLLAVAPPQTQSWRQVGWDNDELDAVLDAIARGHGLPGLWAAVTKERTGFERGVLWYALERVETRGGEWTEAERVERAARFFAVCGLADRPRPKLEGVVLRGGTFWMGSPEGVGDRDERPRHEERVAPFTLGRTSVTVAQYRTFDPSVKGEDDLPVTEVDWFTARLFAAWIGGRLPTEVEWEYACRAGTSTLWSCGDDEARLGDHAWYAPNSGGRPHPVGQRRPNPWGLYDMHGNVWEWCESRALPRGSTARRGPVRVLRGGAHLTVAHNCRSAYKHWYVPGVGSGERGFRVVLPPRAPSGSSLDQRS